MKRTLLALVGCALFSPTLRAAEPAPDRLPPAAARTVDFVRDIQPIFARGCVGCHGAEKQRGGVQLDDGAAALKGGNSGPILLPGEAAKSRLLQVVAGLDPELRMPPGERKPLSREEVSLLRAWIEQGAKWPKGTATATASGPSHWAFRPIRRPALPGVRNQGWVRNGIDHFVLARLEKEGIAPSAEADRLTLLRRVHLDLLGLLPEPAEVERYLADQGPGAYERMVDRLLASPHYGERWGRHWLDAARYADSDGYEKDSPRPYAWRYRSWVIDALNGDLPYDRMVVEQLAGDLLPGATSQQKLATGFHRNTLTNREGGVDREQFRVEAVVDRVNTTATVFLGITLGCAQCHDHKYDPFSQREYYQLLAFFNSDVEADIPVPLPPVQEASFTREKEAHARKLKQLEGAVARYRDGVLPAKLRAWEKGLSQAERSRLPEGVRKALAVDEAKRTPAQRKALADHQAKGDAELARLTRAVTDHQKRAPQPPLAQTLALGQERKTHIHLRGDFLRPGVEVRAETPRVLGSLPATEKPTRLDLARWLVAPENPLTRRVLVNWVWHKYFGRGIVPTLNDFGTQGEAPSHPELLDWLAEEVLRERWSLKALHRLIVTSATYRQSSAARPELLERDPYNVLLAHQARPRLAAEAIRDISLQASGLLSRKVGGPSVRPPQPPGVSELTYAGSARWVESTGEDRYRRGLYIWFQRTSPYPMLMTFDSPDSNVCVVKREKSNTPLQALTLLNDVVFVESAQALGRRIVGAAEGGTEERLRYAFRVCLSREPSPAELERLTRLHGELVALAQQSPAEAARLAGPVPPRGMSVPEAAAWTALARTLMNLDEFYTRE